MTPFIEIAHVDRIDQIPRTGPFITNSDALCMALLMEHGGKLHSERDHRPGHDCIRQVLETEHHRGLFLYHYGQTDPDENGYIAVMIPKDKFDAASAAEFFSEFPT